MAKLRLLLHHFADPLLAAASSAAPPATANIITPAPTPAAPTAVEHIGAALGQFVIKPILCSLADAAAMATTTVAGRR